MQVSRTTTPTKMPYEIDLDHAIRGRYYQLNPSRTFPVRNDHIDANRVRNLESLVREPHRLYEKVLSTMGRPYYVFSFELTDTDRMNDDREIKERTMMYRRNTIQINSYYIYDIQNLLVEDVEEKKKYVQEHIVKNFLKETIGPGKSVIYAPPGNYGEKGGLLYRSAAKKVAAAKKVGGKRKNKTRRRR